MQVLQHGSWTDGYPDEYRGSEGYRVEVQGVQNLEQLESVYFVRSRSWRTIWSYLSEVGPATVLRKVISRSRESGRNEKFVSAGWGTVLEAPASGRFSVGDEVAFLLPIAPACSSRVVLPEVLLAQVDAARMPKHADAEILHLGVSSELEEDARWWKQLRAWTPTSGDRVSPAAFEIALKEAIECLRGADWSTAARLDVDSTDAVSETRPAHPEIAHHEPPRDHRVPTTLVGFGNYAKTIVLPHVTKHLDVRRIHEIDPTQMQPGKVGDVVWDTSPTLRPGDRAGAVLVAGYHHTHADVACKAMRRGAAAVMEKPLATSREQLSQILETMDSSEGRVFSCFQRRYSPFNDMAFEDLGVQRGEPVSYHAVVFEVPLPEHHWYRWSNSRSRLVSNGCHWVDHFLYMNDYAETRSLDVFAAPDGTVNCSITLENGAFFTMVLTDRGSERMGVQDHVEMRANDVTVRIENAVRYSAENSQRVLRRKRLKRDDAYRRMYGSIAERVANGEAGDRRVEVERPTKLMLDLEDRLNQVLSSTDIAVPRNVSRDALLEALEEVA